MGIEPARNLQKILTNRQAKAEMQTNMLILFYAFCF